MIFAAALHLAAVGVYWGSIYLAQEEEPTAIVRIMKYSDLGPPPSISSAAAVPAVAVSGAAVRPSVGVPVPVPDAEVSPEQTIATQTEMSAVPSQATETQGEGGETVVEQDINIDEPPPDFVPYEQPPMVVKRIEPKYPEIASRAGIEGTVHVKMWVDKEGKVRKVVVLKSDAELFNEPAIEAGMQWVFTPAMQHDGPVSVWVAVPFKFRLKK
jgi:protein TonB